MTKIPVISLDRCHYDKARRVLTLPSEYIGMPATFFVRSHKTGKEIRFTQVSEHDVLFNEDHWDGEQQIYRPLGNVPTVDHLIIYNQY